MNKLQLRAAEKADALEIAKFYRVSSDGVADYIWTQLASPGEKLIDVGRRRYEHEGTNFSYENCTLVVSAGTSEERENIVGMLVAFTMHVNPDYIEEDPILEPFSVLEENDSYYVCGVAVNEAHRGEGIGRLLMNQAEADCREQGLNRLSLLVFDQNSVARDLYYKMGYEVRDRRAVVPHPLFHYSGDVLLMVKQLEEAIA